MSVTVLQLLPNLKQIQKIFETNFVKYGSTIQIDPVSDGNVPSKHKNITTITQINRELLKYGAAKDRISKLAKFNSVKAWLFQSIIIVLVCIVICIVTFKVHFSKTKIWNSKTTIDISKSFILYLIGMILLIWILYASIHYTKGYTAYNRIVNNIEDFQNTGNVISLVVKMLDIKPVDNGKSFEVNKANPLYLHFFAAKYGEDRIKDLRGKKKNLGGEEEEEVIKPFEMKTDDVVIKEADNILYPFIGANAIDPFVLKKDLQKFDYFDQMSRLSQAIKAFEVMLSKSNNIDMKIKAVDPEVMQANIIEVLVKSENLAEKQAEYIQTIVDLVIISDRSQTYILDENQIKSIAFAVKGGKVDLEDGVVLSVLNAIAPLIEKVRIGSKEDDEIKFITYNDFVEQISAMSSKDFIIKVVYNAEKIRAATSGIAEFNALYNTSILYDTKMSIAKTSLIILGIVIILCLVFLVIYTYGTLESVTSNEKDEGAIEQISEKELNDLCKELFSNTCDTKENTPNLENGRQNDWPKITKQGAEPTKGLLGPGSTPSNMMFPTGPIASMGPGSTPAGAPNMQGIADLAPILGQAGQAGVLDKIAMLDKLPGFTDAIKGLAPRFAAIAPAATDAPAIPAPAIAPAVSTATTPVLGGGGTEPTPAAPAPAPAPKAPADAVAEAVAEGPVKKMAENSRKVFIVTIISCSSILLYIILWSLYNKNVAFNTYNTTMMEDNSFIMQTKALAVMQSIYDDVKKDVFGIKEIGLTEEKIVNLMKEKIIIDATKNHDAGASDVPGDLLFEVIVNSSSVDEQNFIKLKTTRNSLNEVYTSLCEIISSYNKCNNIYALARNGIPFPWTSVVVYIIMLLICALSIMMIAEEFELDPARTKIIRTSYIKQILKELGSKTVLSKDDISYINEMITHQNAVKDTSSDSKRVILFITGIIIMVAVTILFGIVITNEPQLYTSALYSSKQFRANECFD